MRASVVFVIACLGSLPAHAASAIDGTWVTGEQHCQVMDNDGDPVIIRDGIVKFYESSCTFKTATSRKAITARCGGEAQSWRMTFQRKGADLLIAYENEAPMVYKQCR